MSVTVLVTQARISFGSIALVWVFKARYGEDRVAISGGLVASPSKTRRRTSGQEDAAYEHDPHETDDGREKSRIVPNLLWLMLSVYERSDLNDARKSVTKSSGCSQAAKWVPLSC